MYEIDALSPGYPGGLWPRIAAARALAEAIEALQDAGTALLPLLADSDWQADGVRALHDLITELLDAGAAEVGVLLARQGEVDLVR